MFRSGVNPVSVGDCWEHYLYSDSSKPPFCILDMILHKLTTVVLRDQMSAE